MLGPDRDQRAGRADAGQQPARPWSARPASRDSTQRVARRRPRCGTARAGLPCPGTAWTTTPGVPRSCSSYRACSPDSPAMSPGWYSGCSSMISAVTSPTCAEQRRREVAGRAPAAGWPAMIRRARDRGDAAAHRRGQLLAPEDDRLDERLGAGRLDRLHVRRRRRCRPAGPGRGRTRPGRPPSSWVLSMPTRDTCRSVTSGWPPAPRMSPRSASTAETPRFSPSTSDGSTDRRRPGHLPARRRPASARPRRRTPTSRR